MSDFDDPLDLIDNGDGGAVEISLLEEDEKRQVKRDGKKIRGCFPSLLMIVVVILFVGYLASIIL